MTETAEYRHKIDPSRAEYELEEWPFYHISKLTARYQQRMDAALKPIGLDVARWRVLNILARAECATITEISQEAVSKMSTMAKIIQRMTAQGLVTTRVSAGDARATEVILTDRGREMLDIAVKHAGAIARQAFYGVTDDEIRAMNQISRKIYGNLLL